jgi:site-specific DNA-methyltransferase (adenine-specific)
VKPYYEDGAVTIYHGRCEDVLPGLGDVSACLTDPPYNLGIEYGDAVDDARADYAAWCADWFAPVRERAQAVALTPGIANLGLWHEIAAPDWVIAWHKPAAMGRCRVGFNNWEPVLYWGPARSVADVIVAPLVPDASLDGHPCPKPLRWAAKLLTGVLAGTGPVLDPFSGSGTTLRAAKDLGRKAIGIETEERYCEMAAKRCAQDVLDFGVAA